jgi:hypothetical protein
MPSRTLWHTFACAAALLLQAEYGAPPRATTRPGDLATNVPNDRKEMLA